MKRTWLTLFSAFLIVALATAIISNDNLAKQKINDYKTGALEKKQEEKLAKEREKQLAEKEKLEAIEKQIEAEEQKKIRGTFSLQLLDSKSKIFINKVDGYTLHILRDMTVDMEHSEVKASLKNEELTIEIYREEIDKNQPINVDTYINYSNSFLTNKTDHKTEEKGQDIIDGKQISYVEWSRSPLENIKNDKNHYACVEIVLDNKDVITMMFKSSKPYENKSYLEIAKTITFINKSAEPFSKTIKQAENKSWNKKTKATYEKYFGEESKLSWGIFENEAPLDFTELNKIEKAVDYKFPILLYYTSFIENAENHPKLAPALANAKTQNRIIELTLQTIEQKQGNGNMVYDVLDGKYDVYLENYAKEVVSYGEPILFRLGNEMNGDWCVYSAHHTSKDTEIFKEFYRYIYKIFEKQGADNVIWVWNPNGKSFPDFKWNDEICYYPGDEYVDVIGMTSYNTGTYYEGENWTEFDEMYSKMYDEMARQYKKPLMITEFSSSSVGGSKEQWVENMFKNISKYDRIKVAIWWDGCDWDENGNIARSYFIDETPQLVNVFKENLKVYK